MIFTENCRLDFLNAIRILGIEGSYLANASDEKETSLDVEFIHTPKAFLIAEHEVKIASITSFGLSFLLKKRDDNLDENTYEEAIFVPMNNIKSISTRG